MHGYYGCRVRVSDTDGSAGSAVRAQNITTRHVSSATHAGAFDVLKTQTTQVWPETLEKSSIFTLAGRAL